MNDKLLSYLPIISHIRYFYRQITHNLSLATRRLILLPPLQNQLPIPYRVQNPKGSSCEADRSNTNSNTALKYAFDGLRL